jgi:hypothetical protein
MKLNTKSVDRTGNLYCGPLVIAALLNCSTGEATAAVRRVTGKDGAIKGMHNGSVLATLQAHGYTCAEMPVPKVCIAARGVGEPKGVVTHGAAFWKDATGHRLPQAHEGDYAQWCAMKMTGITFAAWLRQRKNKAGTYLVNVTGHYVLVSGRKFVDTYTKGEWVNIGKAPHRRTRVVKVWEITK